MDFFSRQDSARRTTRRLVFLFVLAVLAIMVAMNLVAWFLFGAQSGEVPSFGGWMQNRWFWLTSLLTLGLIVLGSSIRWLQLRGGGKALAKMVGARQVLPDSNDRLEQRLLNVAEEMSIASGTPVPSVYIMDEESGINAFVAGLETSDTILVVTRGTLEQLSRQELQGVVAHEFSHIFNGDMRINVKLISVLAGILILGQTGEFLMHALRFGQIGRASSRSRDSGGAGIIAALFLLGIAMMVLGYIGIFFGRLIKAGISRQREYLADASAVQYARDNEGIAGALIKIRGSSQGALLENRHAEETSHMCFGQPIRMNLNSLLATHPPLDARIKALKPDWQPDQPSTTRDAPPASGEMPAQAAGFAGAPDALVDSVGNPSPAHRQYAAGLIAGLPAPLRQAARQTHAQSSSRHLVLALLLTDNHDHREPLLQEIEATLGTGQALEVARLMTPLGQVQRRQRLALIDLAIPSLRRLSDTDAAALLKLMKSLIRQDQQITPFEYLLYSLLRKALGDSSGRDRRSLRSWKGLESEIALIVSSVLDAGGEAAEKQQQAFEAAMASFGFTGVRWQAQGFEAEKIHRALSRLSRLSPLLKKPLLTTLADCARQDGILRVEEIELIRAIAEHLDCPMPPALQQ